MEGRMMIKISRLPTKAATNAVDGNWVTIGVIVAKLPPKDSSKVGVCNLRSAPSVRTEVDIMDLQQWPHLHVRTVCKHTVCACSLHTKVCIGLVLPYVCLYVCSCFCLCCCMYVG